MKHHVQISNEALKRKILNTYSKLDEVIIREIIQNSVDAGADTINFIFGENSYLAEDNGRGMNEETFMNIFMGLGETTKIDAGAIGGFGAGREPLVYIANKWSIQTGNFVVRGSYGDFDDPVATECDGFTIFVGDEYFGGLDFAESLKYIMSLSYLPECTVAENGADVKQGHYTSGIPFATLDFCRIYAVFPRDGEQEGLAYVRTGGLFMYSFYVGGPFTFYIELTVPSTQVLKESRQEFQWTYRNQVDKALQGYIIKHKTINGEIPKLTRYIPGFKAVELPKQVDSSVVITAKPDYLEAHVLTDKVATYLDEPNIDDFPRYGKVILEEKPTDEDFEFIVIGDEEPNMDTIRYALKVGEIFGKTIIPGQAEETMLLYHRGSNYLLIGELPDGLLQRYDRLVSEMSMHNTWWRGDNTEIFRRQIFSDNLDKMDLL